MIILTETIIESCTFIPGKIIIGSQHSLKMMIRKHALDRKCTGVSVLTAAKKLFCSGVVYDNAVTSSETDFFYRISLRNELCEFS